MRLRSLLAASFAVAAICLATPRQAAADSFTLNQSGSLGSGPFGTVTVTQFGVGVVDVLVSLNEGVGFVDTGSGDHPDFAWSLAGHPALTSGDITIVNSGINGPWTWAFQGGGVSTSDNLGGFDYALLCSGAAAPGFQRCGNGASNPDFGPLEFRIALAGITPASFVVSSGGSIHALFAGDVVSGNGNTGLVWTTDRTTQELTATPEPGTMILVGTGIAAAARRFRKRRV